VDEGEGGKKLLRRNGGEKGKNVTMEEDVGGSSLRPGTCWGGKKKILGSAVTGGGGGGGGGGGLEHFHFWGLISI